MTDWKHLPIKFDIEICSVHTTKAFNKEIAQSWHQLFSNHASTGTSTVVSSRTSEAFIVSANPFKINIFKVNTKPKNKATTAIINYGNK